MMFLFLLIFSLICSFGLFGIALIYYIKHKLKKKKYVEKLRDDRFCVGIFHPFVTYCHDEDRILWGIIQAIQQRYPQFRIIVYTGDTDTPPEKILAIARIRLGINSINFVEFIYLQKREFIDPSHYTRFPKLRVNVGSIFLALEALWEFVPDIIFDTMGFPLAFPVWKYFGSCKIGSYMTNPPEMLYGLGSRGYIQSMRNKYVNLLHLLTYSKFYRTAFLYAAKCSDIILVSSSWLEEHINNLWSCESKVFRVYPPCPIDFLKSSVKKEEGIENLPVQIVSLAPFTIQGDHPFQIRTLFQFRQLVSEEEWENVKLVFIGNCNTHQEASRVKDMEDLCKHLSVEDNVIFRLNLSYAERISEFSKSLIGLHATCSDSFNIGIVECLAAGVICVVHNSGGMSHDITIDYSGSRNAFLAIDELEYAETIRNIIHMGQSSKAFIISQAQASVERFTEAQFYKSFIQSTEIFFQ